MDRLIAFDPQDRCPEDLSASTRIVVKPSVLRRSRARPTRVIILPASTFRPDTRTSAVDLQDIGGDAVLQKASVRANLSLGPSRQLASEAFPNKLVEYGMVCSMSRNGDCRDNAPTESLFNGLKSGAYRARATRAAPRRSPNLFAVIEALYKRSPCHSASGYVSQSPFLRNWITTRHGRNFEACPRPPAEKNRGKLGHSGFLLSYFVP